MKKNYLIFKNILILISIPLLLSQNAEAGATGREMAIDKAANEVSVREKAVYEMVNKILYKKMKPQFFFTLQGQVSRDAE